MLLPQKIESNVPHRNHIFGSMVLPDAAAIFNELPRSKLRGIKPPLARSYGPPVWRGNTGSCVHSLEQPQLDVLAIQLRRGFFTALLPDICAHDFFMPMTTYGTNEIPLGPKFATP